MRKSRAKKQATNNFVVIIKFDLQRSWEMADDRLWVVYTRQRRQSVFDGKITPKPAGS